MKGRFQPWSRWLVSIVFMYGLWLAVAAHLEAQSRLEGDGHVLGVDEPNRMLFLAHGPIPGFMPAPMRHGFAVHRVELLRGLKKGDRVHFVLEVQNDILGISSIEQVGDDK